jgi:outer membrane lipoprotein-sorting protein
MHRTLWAVSLCLVTLSLPALALPAASAAPAGPTFKGDPRAVGEVQAAFQKFAAARTWRARMVSGDSTTTTAFVAPDRFHMTIVQDNTTTEMFMIGREVWMKTGGTCQKLPAAVPVKTPKEMIEHGAAETTITVTKGGAASVEGTPTQTYLLTVESRGTTVREKLYVATKSGLPRRLEIQGTPPTTIDYFDFGAPITINRPPC